MNIIDVQANEIVDIFFETTYSQAGKERLRRYFEYYGYLEGIPVIERRNNDTYRLITLPENYEFYKLNASKVQFKAKLKTFQSDDERYLEVLKQLFDGKSNSNFNDKYIILQNLLFTLTDKEISEKIKLPISRIREFIFTDDKYKIYLEKSLKHGVRTNMEAVVSYLKKSPYIKEKTSIYILNFVIFGQDDLVRMSKYKWDIARTILEGVKWNYKNLTVAQQILIFNDIIKDGWTVLIDYFNTRCAELNSDNDSGEEDCPFFEH
jgi:hypothetical protein